MKIEEVKVGERYTFFPKKESADDSRHFPCEVVYVKKLVRVRIFMLGAEEEVLRSVSAKRLQQHGELAL